MSQTIDDITNTNLVALDLDATDRWGAIDALADLIEADGRLTDKNSYVQAVRSREEETGGTAMEMGIAIPHAKSAGVRTPGVAFGRTREPIDFGEEKADLVFLIAAPTALMAPSHWIAETLVPARAAENQVYVAYANRVGVEGELTYIGRSCVAGPEGRIVSAGPSDETLLFADVDVAAIEHARRRHCYLAERRPALYEA